MPRPKKVKEPKDEVAAKVTITLEVSGSDIVKKSPGKTSLTGNCESKTNAQKTKKVVNIEGTKKVKKLVKDLQNTFLRDDDGKAAETKQKRACCCETSNSDSNPDSSCSCTDCEDISLTSTESCSSSGCSCHSTSESSSDSEKSAKKQSSKQKQKPKISFFPRPT